MKTQDSNDIAVLIDADNTQPGKLEFVLREISTRGRIVVKRAYGNWMKPALGPWGSIMKELAVKAVQQFDYVAGKNATDIALTIDAMDLLSRRIYDSFVIVSSDSDFTPLAIKLHESGVEVIGVGTRQTSPSFRNACDAEGMYKRQSGGKGQYGHCKIHLVPQEPGDSYDDDASDDMPLVHELLVRAWERLSGESGWSNMATAGNYLKRAKPDFDCRSYGYAKLSNLIEDFPERYDVRRVQMPNGPDVVYYRVR